MSYNDPLLSRRSHKPPPALRFLSDDMTLPLSRVHEICGQARRTMALWLAAEAIRKTPGPIFWITPSWSVDRLNMDGVAPLCPPQTLTFVDALRPEDLLWSMEEVLRSGVAPVVVADLPNPPAMTPVRRLHLAAERGTEDGTCRPLGLLLTPGTGGAPGVETRWRIEPDHGADRMIWQLDRLRARMAPQKSWRVTTGTDDAVSRYMAGSPRLAPRDGPETTPKAQIHTGKHQEVIATDGRMH